MTLRHEDVVGRSCSTASTEWGQVYPAGWAHRRWAYEPQTTSAPKREDPGSPRSRTRYDVVREQFEVVRGGRRARYLARFCTRTRAARRCLPVERRMTIFSSTEFLGIRARKGQRVGVRSCGTQLVASRLLDSPQHRDLEAADFIHEDRHSGGGNERCEPSGRISSRSSTESGGGLDIIDERGSEDLPIRGRLTGP